MSIEIERNLGTQPVKQLMSDHKLTAQDLVAASTNQLSFKMVNRACKGRRLTINVKSKILNALNKATGKEFSMDQLFTY